MKSITYDGLDLDYPLIEDQNMKKKKLGPHSRFEHSTSKVIKLTLMFLSCNPESRIAKGSDEALSSVKEFLSIENTPNIKL